jgi:hypothetical protein
MFWTHIVPLAIVGLSAFVLVVLVGIEIIGDWKRD